MKTAGRLLIWIVAVYLTVGVSVEAQQPTKIARIGSHLTAACPDTQSARTEAFRQGLRDLGHIEGQNIAIELRCAEGKPDRLPDLAAELIQIKLDLIVTAGNEATQAARRHATGTIPPRHHGIGSCCEWICGKPGTPGGKYHRGNHRCARVKWEKT